MSEAEFGQVTDYDRLVLEIKTDGTISPHDALSEASRILVQHFSLVAGVTEEEPISVVEEEGDIPARLFETPIEDLDLTVRAYNCLKRAGITQVGEVLEKLQKGEDEILAIRNFGQKSLDELRDKLRQKGFLDEMNEITNELEITDADQLLDEPGLEA